MYTLNSKKAIDFYNNNPHIDFNSINEVFVSILENLLGNLTDKIDNSQNTFLLKQLSEKITQIEQNQNTQINEYNKTYQSISSVLNQHIDNLNQSIRDIILANSSTSQETLLNHITSHQQLLTNHLESLYKNEGIENFIEHKIKHIHDTILLESNKLLTTVDSQNSDSIIRSIDSLLSNKHNELDTAVKTRIDCFVSSHSQNNQSAYGEILNKLNQQITTIDKVNVYFDKQLGSNSKGKLGENKLELILSELFSNASIINTSGLTASGDFIINRLNKTKLLIDTKDFETVVPVKEVEKIIRDMEMNNCNAILLSQNSGIAQKNNFEINVHNNNIIIYIHYANYDPNKIALAVNIIDYLEPILVSQKNNNHQETISSELLSNINKEYQELVSQKLNLINLIKRNHSEVLKNLQKLDLPVLTTLLNQKFANTGKTAFTCKICNVFIGKNAKSLAAHQRKCEKTTIEATN